MARTSAFEDVLNLGTIPKTNRCACGIDNQLAGEIASNLLLVVEKKTLELIDVVELARIRQCGARIYRLCQVEFERLAILAVTLLALAVAKRAVFVPPAAEHIKIFQRKPSGVDFRVAS